MTDIPLGAGAEFDRIRAIAAALGPAASGLGNDCAVLPPGFGEVVISTDMSVEGVHFRQGLAHLEGDRLARRIGGAFGPRGRRRRGGRADRQRRHSP